MNPNVTEKETQATILDYLAIKHIFHWRQNTGAMRGEHKGKKWFVQFGDKGSPDIFAVIDGNIYGIEVKSPKGKMSESQKDYEERFVAAGGVYILARDVDDVIKKLK